MKRIWILPALVLLTGCSLRTARAESVRVPRKTPDREITMRVTGYCPCGECCNWKRNWLFRPVIASGPNKGKHKKVGCTASGKMAGRGTIAADARLFPFGAIMYVPGYGYGIVEDRGSAIKGHHIDLFYRSHLTANKWGSRKLRVKVWYPPRKAIPARR